MIEARVRARRIACQVRAAHYLPQVMATQAAFSTAVLRASLVAPIALLLPQLGVGATLEGRVQYPGRAIPAATVYARNTETAALHSLALRRNEATFRFELPPGKYWVFVRPAEPGLTELYGAHTSYSTCRQRPAHLVDACTDHAILEVEVGTTPRRAPSSWTTGFSTRVPPRPWIGSWELRRPHPTRPSSAARASPSIGLPRARRSAL